MEFQKLKKKKKKKKKKKDITIKFLSCFLVKYLLVTAQRKNFILF